VSSNYWSSTTNANNTNNAWNVNFNNGNVNNNNKSNNNYVRAVRGGKCSLLSFESVYHAYLDCRKRKRGTFNALRFEYNLLENLFDLASDLQKGRYRPSRTVCFVTQSPKLREIFAADFRDRVVHHLVVRSLEKIWEPFFIHDSYACRIGKGTHAAIKRLQRFMLKASRNQRRKAFFLQLDIRSFFTSIDKYILFSLLKQKVQSDVLLDLLSAIIFQDCVKDHLFKGNRHMLEKIPAHKSLFKSGKDRGLPIGNLTSQFFANAYLNELDQFVKHHLRCRFYLRYVDDFILISSSTDQLITWREQIQKFLKERLALDLKKGSAIRRVSEGADFLGYIVRPGYVLSRRRVVHNLKDRLACFKDKMVHDFHAKEREIWKLSLIPEVVVELRQMLASYLGHFRHANTFNLVAALFEKNAWLKEIFLLKGGKLVGRFKYNGVFRSLNGQVRFYKDRLKGYILFFQVGKYTELYGNDALLLSGKFGFALKKGYRGMNQVVGFPKRMTDKIIRQVLFLKYNAALITESVQGRYIKDRYVKELYLGITNKSS
jgi:RNA-directed DNA polymerase